MPLKRAKLSPPTDAPQWPDRDRITLWQLVGERRMGRAALLILGADDDEPFTCDACAHASRCALAFDPYNTHGDCLAEK